MRLRDRTCRLPSPRWPGTDHRVVQNVRDNALVRRAVTGWSSPFGSDAGSASDPAAGVLSSPGDEQRDRVQVGADRFGIRVAGLQPALIPRRRTGRRPSGFRRPRLGDLRCASSSASGSGTSPPFSTSRSTSLKRRSRSCSSSGSSTSVAKRRARHAGRGIGANHLWRLRIVPVFRSLSALTRDVDRVEWDGRLDELPLGHQTGSARSQKGSQLAT